MPETARPQQTSAPARKENIAMRLVRGEILHFFSDPGDDSGAQRAQTAFRHHADGGLLVGGGRIAFCGDWADALAAAPAGTPVDDHGGRLLLPGFVDTHVHYPQTDIIGSPGKDLLDWLDRYTFPAERPFGDEAVAAGTAEFFCDELLRNGTTTALVFGTVHPQSVDAFFRVAQRRELRMVAGKVMMDRHCPAYLRDTAQSSYDDSRRLIERWHGADRLRYAITPRFAITSSDAQLQAAGTLAREFPTVALHSHVAESRAEVDRVRELYPQARSYLDVYDRFGLLRRPAVYAHCIYLDAQDRRRMAGCGTAAAFSPTSNLFLGSGLFDLRQALDDGVTVGVATDVGGGTSFSMLRTLAAARQVSQLNGYPLPALRAFWLATLSGAVALGLDDCIGNFAEGKEADFVVLDPQATPLLARRMARAQTLEERLFLWMTLGDDRSVSATYIRGRCRWQRDAGAPQVHLR